MQQQDDTLQQQIDALHQEMMAMAAFYNRQCARRMGARLRQKLQERHQSQWRIRPNRLHYHARRWSSRGFLWGGQALIKVAHWLDPDKHTGEGLTQQKEPMIDNGYPVI